MFSDFRGWLRTYTLGNMFYTLAWGLYFSSSRIYVKEALGGSFTDITLLTSLEFLPALLSAFWGYLGDFLGRRKMVLLGFLSVPAFMMIGFTGIPWVLILAFIASLASTIAWPSIVAAVVSDIENVGSRKYSIYAMGGSLGWGIGSILMGFLYRIGHMKLVSIMVALFIGLAFTLFYITYPETYRQSSKRTYGINLFKIVLKNKVLMVFLLTVIISYFGLEFSYNILSIKLYNELGRNEVFYGIFFGGITAFLGALFRPLAGRIVDTLGELRSFTVALMGYTVLLYGLALARGWTMALLWIIPIYPLYDTAAVTVASKSLVPELRATAIGAYSTSISIAGSLVVIAGPIADSLGVNGATVFSAILQFVALIFMGLYFSKAKRILKEKFS